MSDYTPLMGGLSAVKTGFDLVKAVREALRQEKVDPKEISGKLLEIQELLLEAQSELRHAEEYNNTLRQEIETLRQYAEIGKGFTFAEGIYWYQQYPYCPVCWDVEKKPTRLSGPGGGSMPPYRDSWSCPFHTSAYLTSHRH